MSKTFYKALGKTEIWPEISGVNPCEITYDDVLLVPQANTQVASRVLPDISVKLGPYLLTKPIMVAPMDTICGEKMIRLMHRLGGIGVLPRGDLKKNCELCKQLTKEKTAAVYALGLRDFLNQARAFRRAGAKVLLLDVAHGGIKLVAEAAKEIQEKLKLTVICGNIASFDQAMAYKKAGLKIARVGVGPGGLCITRLVAGTGLPQMAAVLETAASGLQIIADGGIRKPADMVKAIAAGADLVMIGSLLAGTEETPGEVIGGKKKARGQASADYMKDNEVKMGEFRAAEGIYTMVEVKGSAEHVIKDLTAGLRSAMCYVGANNLKEFQEKAQFVLVSKATIRENQAHILWE
ncbi:MAG: Inosine-5'-monophosphate dehydrogenase [Candidatus Beckwithbacteria bacterium GW2011_GWA2_43_10]|uniref:Inosine-5'-monophosphate dehydrogenase n=1 Tax=Candidatus Beckwithbacteria bacterium GW2011_GWA2_43_10 TaxID=1618369 RepID=A0A0G1F113_9BACT|nr:MAG: Inosine-5'-monophosphate dehydrogenase [Candidatus Beckwithbacteria bacterium GW2011_GWA2_43_10]